MRGEGLELIAIGKTEWFPVDYDFAEKGYRDSTGKVRKDVMDIACMACGRAYYTLERDMLPFCPFCGVIERGGPFTMFNELQAFLTEQNWGYLKHTPWKPFGVTRGDGWQLKFSPTIETLQRAGFHEIQAVRV